DRGGSRTRDHFIAGRHRLAFFRAEAAVRFMPAMSSSNRPSVGPHVLQRARCEGVSRPRQILSRMAPGLRSEGAATRRPECRRPGEAVVEAWDIIHRDRSGLQARTHSLPEMVSPFSRNNNWSEILLRTASRLRIEVDPSLSATKLEKAIFEHMSRSFVGTL